jgi:hypothetical protein
MEAGKRVIVTRRLGGRRDELAEHRAFLEE